MPYTYNCKCKLEMLQSSASEQPWYMPKVATIHYLNVCHGGKSRSRSAKKQRLQWLPHSCHSARYEHSSSSHGHTGTGKLKSRSRHFDPFFAKVKVAYAIYSLRLRPFQALAVIVTKRWAFKVFPLNVCHWRKSRPRSSG